MDKNILYEYNNGNTSVTILEDGTKIREWGEGEIPSPDFPESVDMKITNRCFVGCPYCHENSHNMGRHASYELIDLITNGLPKGTEIAIGGGDPLEHPQLVDILKMLRGKGIIPNMTINTVSVINIENSYELLEYLIKNKLIFGVGISIHLSEKTTNQVVNKINSQNTVVHAIAGIHDPIKLYNCLKRDTKILVLGYKEHGRGASYYRKKVSDNIRYWNYWLSKLSSKFKLSFDNLAVKQLQLQKRLSDEDWEKFYMGNDGTFTMYVDAVSETFSKSSIYTKRPLSGMTITKAFNNLDIIYDE